jgi:SAM-dependent methyltransferase
MTEPANAEQFEAWNGDGGERWVASADERDRILAPVADALLAVAAPTPGLRVLDVGCGCGATTLRTAGLVGDTGSVTGFDISAPMLDVARQRADVAGSTNTSFVQGDAQTQQFEPGSVDLVISRFGTMFFSDLDAAFSNIATALTATGRICFATWRPLEANEWLAVPGAALLAHADLPPSIDGPGMFAQSDPEAIKATLRAAGCRNIAIEAADVTFTIGQTIDEAVAYLSETGPGRVLLDTIPEGAARDAAIADVHASLAGHHDASGVRLGGGIWLISATR